MNICVCRRKKKTSHLLQVIDEPEQLAISVNVPAIYFVGKILMKRIFRRDKRELNCQPNIANLICHFNRFIFLHYANVI